MLWVMHKSIYWYCAIVQCMVAIQNTVLTPLTADNHKMFSRIIKI